VLVHVESLVDPKIAGITIETASVHSYHTIAWLLDPQVDSPYSFTQLLNTYHHDNNELVESGRMRALRDMQLCHQLMRTLMSRLQTADMIKPFLMEMRLVPILASNINIHIHNMANV